jgi:hypothetical protein
VKKEGVSKIFKHKKFWTKAGSMLAVLAVLLLAMLSIANSENASGPQGTAGSQAGIPANSSGFLVDSSTDNNKALTTLSGTSIGSASAPENRLPLVDIPIQINYTFPMRGIVGLYIDADLSGYTEVCAIWSVFSDDGETKMCYGSTGCCGFAGLEPKWSQWNTVLFLTRGANGVAESNLVTVQLLASAGDLIQNFQQSDVERMNVIISNTTDMGGSSVQPIEGMQQTRGVYMQLSEPGATGQTYNVDVAVGELTQGETKIDLPVDWHQQIRLKNNEPVAIDYNLNLWDLASRIGPDFLNDVRDFQMSSEGRVISETAVATLHLEQGEEKLIDLFYLTPPVMMEKNCTILTISQLLPDGAVVVNNEISLETPVRTVCDIRIYHNTVTHYRDIKVDFPDMDKNAIESVYYVEGDTFLSLNDNSVIVPALSDS